MTEGPRVDYTSHIERAKRAAANYLDSIKRAYLPPNAGAPAAFILLTCYIDFLGSLYAGKDATPGTFEQFLTRFMSPGDQPSMYDPKELYNSLRNRLVHNYAIWNARYFLVHGLPQAHLAKVEPSGQILNLENFYHDVANASARYFQELESNPGLQQCLARRLDKVGILDDVQLRFSGQSFAAA